MLKEGKKVKVFKTKDFNPLGEYNFLVKDAIEMLLEKDLFIFNKYLGRYELHLDNKKQLINKPKIK